jgi:hypothetical protein
MNLYLISQNVNTGSDTYDSAVVAALSEDDARAIHPSKYEAQETWCDKENVTVKLIGTATTGIKAGVICASFNAG